LNIAVEATVSRAGRIECVVTTSSRVTRVMIARTGDYYSLLIHWRCDSSGMRLCLDTSYSRLVRRCFVLWRDCQWRD